MATPPLSAGPPDGGASTTDADERDGAPLIEVVIEVPRGSPLKRDADGRLVFVSPFPCPFNYGSAHDYIGLDGDLLDAVVLGPRLPRGARVRVRALAAVRLTDRDVCDDKLVCGEHPLRARQRFWVLVFFRFYAGCKRLLNLVRGRPGRTVCEGWCEAAAAISRARPRDATARRPRVPF